MNDSSSSPPSPEPGRIARAQRSAGGWLRWGGVGRNSYHFSIKNNGGFANAVSLYHAQESGVEVNADGGTVVPQIGHNCSVVVMIVNGRRPQQQIASILPGIPQVDGILGQGGDEYGALQAFLAAGRKVPVIIGGNRGNFLKWWSEQKAKTGYKSYSWAANPWSAASGLYVAIDLLRGEKVPKTMIMPALSITQEMVDGFANLKADEVAAKEYDHDWIVKTYYK